MLNPDSPPGAMRGTLEVVTPLIHVKGYAAPETKAAVEGARLLIEQAQSLGETPKTRCCCFQSSTASGPHASSLSTAMRCASLRRNSCRSPKGIAR